jgi:hypothetical protein
VRKLVLTRVVHFQHLRQQLSHSPVMLAMLLHSCVVGEPLHYEFLLFPSRLLADLVNSTI